ncbi:MAG: transglutaminase-like cysteine peptidase [Pseudorhizobium sp.]
MSVEGKQSSLGTLVLPALAFPEALTMLATPPRFDDVLPTEQVVTPSVAKSHDGDRVVALTTPVNLPARSNVRPGKKSDVFDSVALPFKRLAALKRFVPVMQDLKGSQPLQCKSTGCSRDPGTQLDAADLTGLSIRDRLNLVNVAVNRSIEYRRDMDTYGVMDRWATPTETMSRLQGDCEDFAILKMAALKSYGVSLDQMSLVVIYDQKRRFYHAVLSVEVDGRNYILDNLSDQVRLDSQLSNYVALYSIRNGKGYLHGARDKGKAVAGATPLSEVAPGEGLAQNEG